MLLFFFNITGILPLNSKCSRSPMDFGLLGNTQALHLAFGQWQAAPLTVLLSSSTPLAKIDLSRPMPTDMPEAVCPNSLNNP